MKPHYKMTLILALYFIFLLFVHHPECYPPIVKFMDDWNWLLSGLSAGGFAVFFSRWISKEKDLQHQRSLAALALIELNANCEDMVQSFDFPSFIYHANFTTRSSWDEAKLPLTHYLHPKDFETIEAAYREMKLFENILNEQFKHTPKKLTDAGVNAISHAQKAFDILQKASGITELTFPKSEFENFP